MQAEICVTPDMGGWGLRNGRGHLAHEEQDFLDSLIFLNPQSIRIDLDQICIGFICSRPAGLGLTLNLRLGIYPEVVRA